MRDEEKKFGERRESGRREVKSWVQMGIL